MSIGTLSFAALLNIGMIVGVVFLLILNLIVSKARKLPPRQKNSGGSVKSVAIIGILFFVTAIILGVTVTSYYLDHAEVKEEQTLKTDLESQLQQSLVEVAYLSQKSSVSQTELETLRMQLEDTLNRLNEERSRSRIITVIDPGFY